MYVEPVFDAKAGFIFENKDIPTSFVKSDLYKQGLVLFLNTVWRLCKCDLKVSTHTLRPDT
jgi:hypothetical protein